jgi:hypothetical protein
MVERFFRDSRGTAHGTSSGTELNLLIIGVARRKGNLE